MSRLAHPNRGVRFGFALLATSGLVVALATSARGAFHLTVVSKNSNGVAANGYSTTEGSGGAISGDGRLAAFASNAANLPHGDGSTFRCYVRNLETGKTRLVSVTSNGVPATGDTFSPAISADRRVVAFHGDGNGLPGANGQGQVWAHNLNSGTTRLASRANDGDPATGGNSAYPSLSGDGRFVAFESYASNLPGAEASTDLMYLRDLKAGKTLIGSRTGAGAPAFGGVYGQPLSFSGGRLAFFSNDADLPHGGDAFDHVYVRDRGTGHVRLVDRTSQGAAANGQSYDVSISGNGRFVAFDSYATNLPGGSGPGLQSYLRDLKLGMTKLVSQSTTGHPQNGYAYYPHVSGDGRYVAFYADGSNLPGGDGSTDEIYVRDLHKGRTSLVSRAANLDPANAYAEYPSISLDGRWVEFYSGATNLGGNPNNQNVFRAGPIG
jgi:Tol biopolymer transport system component